MRASRTATAALLALALAAAVGLSLRRSHYGGPNLYGLQAEAWLAGRLDVPGPAEDLSLVGGRSYVAFPPFPSVVLLPAVALLGHAAVPYRALALALLALAGWVAWRVLARLEVPREDRGWLVAALLGGTALWSCAVQAEGVWFFAHGVASVCALLALEEVLGAGRGWRAGLWAGLAFLSRQLCVYLLPFVVVALWLRDASPETRGVRARAAAGAAPGGGAGVAAYPALNALRFGGPLDTGYAGMPLEGYLDARVQRYGLFHPAYVPFNLFHMFLEGPHFEWAGPRLLAPGGMGGLGTSLTLASPFVFVAFAARGLSRHWRTAAWACVGLTLVHMLHYYNNGWVQLNAQRFSLDFLPLLWVLVAQGTRRVQRGVWRPLVAWAVGLNALALALLPVLQRALRRL